MKALKKIVLVLIILIAIVLIAAAFVSKEMVYEKSITVNTPIETAWENVNSLEDLDNWSPWNDIDPNMKKEMTGTDGEIGATASWDSEVKDVGKGSQTIAKMEAPNLFETDLKFYAPYESEAKGYIKLAKEADATKITWGFHSEMPYPFNLMMVFSDMEEAMGDTWSNGLSKLKQLCEESYKKQLEEEKQKALELQQQQEQKQEQEQEEA
ncbi:SRPBCC family protein [Aquimarina mytili]|uniref:SRPBCC family protein n=1 Tax=Aquimarina mytili TaxID=874423 RepID=A0A936ZVJ8_9FLAO|nr:SRPBCC family protein [Aquimarina mytili]MBL0682785.1 SRPBCC family protein [Aquimarina mytili]